jgi:hypothetical protein
MTTPIFARKDPNNTVNVLDGAFTDDGKFALLVKDAASTTASDAITDKLEELRLQLVTLLGNTDTVETLQQNSINLLTLTNQYVDGLEALVTTLGTNTDGLETLLSTITGHVDALEPLLTDLKTLATTDAAKQDGHQATLTAISNKLPALGQAEMAESLPVTLASDQSAIPVTSPELLAKLEEIRVIDAADATKQDAHTTALATINGKLPTTIGQKDMAASLAVTLASDQPAITVAHAPVTRTPTMENVSAAGTVAAGAVMVSIVNTGTTAATVLGAQLLPGLSVTYAPPKGELLAAISYTASATAPLTIARLA